MPLRTALQLSLPIARRGRSRSLRSGTEAEGSWLPHSVARDLLHSLGDSTRTARHGPKAHRLCPRSPRGRARRVLLQLFTFCSQLSYVYHHHVGPRDVDHDGRRCTRLERPASRFDRSGAHVGVVRLGDVLHGARRQGRHAHLQRDIVVARRSAVRVRRRWTRCRGASGLRRPNLLHGHRRHVQHVRLRWKVVGCARATPRGPRARRPGVRGRAVLHDDRRHRRRLRLRRLFVDRPRERLGSSQGHRVWL